MRAQRQRARVRLAGAPDWRLKS